MPRGNTKGNPKSPIIGDYGLTASKDDLTRLAINTKQNFIADLNRTPIDLHNPDDVKQAIIDYFTDCEINGKRIGNMGLYRALGLTRQDVNNVLTGKSKSKLSLACIDILKKALLYIGEYREQLGAQGKLNPITLLFWQKNFDGLEDNSRVELVASRGQDTELTPEQVAKQIEKDIPIDIE